MNHRRFWEKDAASACKLMLLLLWATGSGSCDKPKIDALDPLSGPPGTVVEVVGDNLLLAQIRWDANQLSEQTLPGSFLSAQFFTVPLSTSTGMHPVRLFGDGEYSDNTVNFDVTTGLVRPNPRLDDITLLAFDIDASSKAQMFLMAHGANIDVGGQISIDGTDQPAHFYRLLRNANLNLTNPSTLEYPILHYATTWTLLTDQVPGSTISVAVRNLDGNLSNTLTYHIPANLDELDSDGDGLYDTWERDGYDADGDGIIDIDLPALGADPLRKDLFIEVDWMVNTDLANPWSGEPDLAVWTAIEDAFANAPVLNSDGSQGIAVHIDHGQASGGGGAVPFSEYLAFKHIYIPPSRKQYCPDETNEDPEKCQYVHLIKSNHFDSVRKEIYRYCVFGWNNGHQPKASGREEAVHSNDFFVTLGSWEPANGVRADWQTGTFMHELGHTLGLHHGGDISVNSKDNYNSVMQYGNDGTWVCGQQNTNGDCIKWEKPSPSQLGGVDTDCDLTNANGVYTYSQGMRAHLDEQHIDETEGVCDHVAVDWVGDGPPFATDTAVNIDADPALTIIRDFADWTIIELNFRKPGSGWNDN